MGDAFAGAGPVADRARRRSCQQAPFDSPDVDYHALAPEIVLTGAIVVVLLVDLFTPERPRGIVPSLAGIGLLAALVPVLTLAVDGADRVMFGGAYVVDNFALVLKALFLRGRLRRRPAVDQLHRRGRLRRGRVLLPAARRRCSA